uniref:Ribosomal protein S16 n=1 Tax=Eustigmatophyceae sp. Ndem 8/9T-3m6.8 TaxID=2506146 RepID=A0A3R5U4Y9_9STRA|nr:ribosomal protein S16 [Eustigmatophyceae sp. Ndem 8/9T-3m6.8]QAA11870.1 ribosomal protein S16 [Eustigmatophyceae sp. Ndem 8/9T-3m6.8]
MLKIRLKRCGRKKRPSYRLVLVPSQWRRDGKFIEELGFYNPITNEVKLKMEQIVVRLKNGAQPSPTVKNFLKKAGLELS